jgi:hypothetical protein
MKVAQMKTVGRAEAGRPGITQHARPSAQSDHVYPSSHRPLERRVALALLAGVATFQLALVAGAPWGAAAWGGQAPGVLPPSLRIGSAVSVLVYGGLAALVVTDRLGRTARRRLLTGASVLLVLGAVANLASQSPVERLWAPVAATLAMMLWRVRGSR